MADQLVDLVADHWAILMVVHLVYLVADQMAASRLSTWLTWWLTRWLTSRLA